MGDFILGRIRDAWFVIRGYKYQIDLTILRWLSIGDTQILVLECGEDIDIVNTVLAKGSGEASRELEQVKHLDTPITLRSPACSAALANAVGHFASNPGKDILFRFCTNASITTERPAAFRDRKPGIAVWESLRKQEIPEPGRTDRLKQLHAFLRGLSKPPDAIDQSTWDRFASFIDAASLDDLSAFVGHFEWSTRQLNPEDLSSEIIRRLQGSAYSRGEPESVAYPRLYVHVMRLLSQRGRKSLDTSALTGVLSLPVLGDQDERLLKFIAAEVLSHDVRLEMLEEAMRRNQEAIASIQEVLTVRVGPVASLNLATAIADISTALPPQVAAIAKRDTCVSKLKLDFCKLGQV